MHSRQGYRRTVAFISALLLSAAATLPTQAQLLWEVGMDDNGWPVGDGGGPNTTFVQEAGVNVLPGDPFSPEENQLADDDYYFSGIYSTVIPANGEYEPVGVVVDNEEAAERAFAGADNDLRYHFNLPADFQPTDLLSVTFDAVNLHDGQPDSRYGIEVYFNNVKVQNEILIRGPQLNVDYTTPQFTLASVDARVGPGFDNIVTLRGINYNADGGGNWMGIDYVQLNRATEVIPPPTFPWSVGTNDNRHITAASNGGPNTAFVQENGGTNALPGNPRSPATNQQADDDYYFGGVYTNVIPGVTNLFGDYTPVGVVSSNEVAAERAFAGTDNFLRYHFNLPNSLTPTNQMAITFEALDLETGAAVADPRYGIEVYFNGVRLLSNVVIRPPQLNSPITTPLFTLASVGAQLGTGFDNVVTLRGISFSGEGGGNWMGIDYVKLDPAIPLPSLPWSVGRNDDAQPAGSGGGPGASFVQENGATNALPGNPASPAVNRDADDDYYFAGTYTTVLPGNGTYQPIGPVLANEEAAERAFAGTDNSLRYHFNLPATVQGTDQFSVRFDAVSLDIDGISNPRYGIEVYYNGVKIQNEIVIGPDEIGRTFQTPAFTLASVNGQAGPGFDNIVTLRGINYSADGGGNWMGIDYVQLNPVLPTPFPWSVGRDDNAQGTTGIGGGPNANFVQEAGVNALPGNPANASVNQRSDDDYYLAGVYTNALPGVLSFFGDYQPLGPVLAHEESAERAFAGSDNDLRYHFNLPSTLSPTNHLMVTFDPFSLDGSGGDPQYGIEIYVNGVLVQSEIIIRPEDITSNRDFTTEPFTLQSVGAQVGPGHDNIVHLKGINHSADGGGNWMGIDFVQLNPLPTIVFPIAVGKDDNGWPVGDGGGPNATFVQETGVNELPGSAAGREVALGADDDYYFAGVYTNTIPSITSLYPDYQPLGVVHFNEEAAERAFAGADNELRYHFNLPTTLNPTNQLTVTFDAFNLHIDAALNPEPRYGIEIYFNGVLVLPETIIGVPDLDRDFTTEPFTLANVNGQTGLGPDNVLTLRGVNYNAEGGGNWMGIDYVQVNLAGGGGGPAPSFAMPVISNGRITLTWTGTGNLEAAPSVLGPWTPITPTPASGYSEPIVLGQNRFYRLRR